MNHRAGDLDRWPVFCIVPDGTAMEIKRVLCVLGFGEWDRG